MRKLVLLGLAQTLLVLAGCGGGGGSGSVATSTSNNGSSGGGIQGSNAVTMVVDSGPNGNDVDTPFITVTICAPGSTANCQTIDHVEVDTGSYGLRIMSSVLSSSLAAALQQEVTASGNSVIECTQFADGYSWGPVKVANVQIAGESASNVPIQVIGDPAYDQTSATGTSEIPTTCSSHGPQEDTVTAFGANGIIGLGVFKADCGPACNTSLGAGGSNPGFYYECPASTWSTTSPCSEIALPESAQVTNPVWLFQTDNNGVIVELPQAAEGASSITGSLIFGIGTESNNSVGGQTILTASAMYGDVSTTYTTQGGTQQLLPFSYFDTGSNAYFFADDSIPTLQSCSSYPGFKSSNPDTWFCPRSELGNLKAVTTGENGAQATVSFSIGNAYTLFGQYSGHVFGDLGASSGSQRTDCTSMSTQDINCAFDFGFPFFLGRSVYIAFAGQPTAWGTGPYYAY